MLLYVPTHIDNNFRLLFLFLNEERRFLRVPEFLIQGYFSYLFLRHVSEIGVGILLKLYFIIFVPE